MFILMSVDKFTKKFRTRESYMESPFSQSDFQKIRRLCELEESRFSKVVIYTTAYSTIVMLTAIIIKRVDLPAIEGLFKFAIFISIIFMIPFAFTLGPYVKVTIEGVTFKSFDNLGKGKTQSDDRFYPADSSENLYAPGTIHYDFVEKIRLMDRPLMRFEADMLNSIQ